MYKHGFLIIRDVEWFRSSKYIYGFTFSANNQVSSDKLKDSLRGQMKKKSVESSKHITLSLCIYLFIDRMLRVYVVQMEENITSGLRERARERAGFNHVCFSGFFVQLTFTNI